MELEQEEYHSDSDGSDDDITLGCVSDVLTNVAVDSEFILNLHKPPQVYKDRNHTPFRNMPLNQKVVYIDKAIINSPVVRMQLIDLDFSSCDLAPKQAFAVARIIEKSPYLQRISLANNKLNDTAACVICAAIGKLTKLTSLHLNNNQFDEPTVRHLADNLPLALLELKLHGNLMTDVSQVILKTRNLLYLSVDVIEDVSPLRYLMKLNVQSATEACVRSTFVLPDLREITVNGAPIQEPLKSLFERGRDDKVRWVMMLVKAQVPENCIRFLLSYLV
jgi:hypothetical protein